MRRAMLSLAFLIATTGIALAQACFPHGTFSIAGRSFVCQGATTCINPAIGDIGRAAPGQGIFLHPMLNNYPPGVIAFVFGHECAHFVGVMNEQAADCMAIKLGRNQGFINIQTLQQICQSVYFSSGDWTHFPGPARCQLMQACFFNP